MAFALYARKAHDDFAIPPAGFLYLRDAAAELESYSRKLRQQASELVSESRHLNARIDAAQIRRVAAEACKRG